MNVLDLVYQALYLTGMGALIVFIGLLYMGIARKVTARIHRRHGPPVHQQFIDVIKLLSKESMSHGWVYEFGTIMVFAGILLTALFIPMGGEPLMSMEGDVLVVMYLIVIGPLGMAMAAGAAGNPNQAVGVGRALIMMFAYELPFIIVLLTIILATGSTSFWDIATSQAEFLKWNIFLFPLSALAADIALQAMMGEKPFDVAIAPHEIASGPMVEFGGKNLGMLMLWHSVAVVIEAAIFVNLFLGGGTNLFTFFAKVLVVFMFAICVNAIFPRFRTDQAFKHFWGWVTFLAVAGLLYAMWGGYI